jgi:hypothetical protein
MLRRPPLWPVKQALDGVEAETRVTPAHCAQPTEDV